MSILPTISGPDDVKKLSYPELEVLGQEIREKVINVTAKNGGHVGPNLGVVELTMAMHRVFNSPDDSGKYKVNIRAIIHFV